LSFPCGASLTSIQKCKRRSSGANCSSSLSWQGGKDIECSDFLQHHVNCMRWPRFWLWNVEFNLQQKRLSRKVMKSDRIT
jgi:hypothetical protein